MAMLRINAVVRVANRPEQIGSFVVPFAPYDLRREMHAGTPVAVLAVVVPNNIKLSRECMLGPTLTVCLYDTPEERREPVPIHTYSDAHVPAHTLRALTGGIPVRPLLGRPLV